MAAREIAVVPTGGPGADGRVVVDGDSEGFSAVAAQFDSAVCCDGRP